MFIAIMEEVRSAMAELAASLPPEELNRAGFRPSERFRPEVPGGAEGWDAKRVSLLERVRSAAS